MIKARKENGKVKRYIEIPKYWAHYAGNFAEQSDKVHESFGFYPVHFPDYAPKLQTRSSELLPDLVEIEGQLYYTYAVTDKSAEQIEAELNAYLDGLDNIWDEQAAKRILKKIMEPVLADEANLSEQDIADSAMLYPYFRVGTAYAIGDRFRYEESLLEVVQSHTSQADWIPTELPALYKVFTPPGVVAEWIQPTGAHDAYAVGVQVTHNGHLWENTSPANVYAPGVYGWDDLGAV